MKSVGEAVLNNISKISSIRHLTLHIASDNTRHLHSLANLRLETLHLDIAPSVVGVDDSAPLTTTAFTHILSRRSLPTLQSLVVVASCRRQLEVVSIFGPTQLKSLELDFFYNDNSSQNKHISPFVLAAYLARNPRLSSLAATGLSIPKDTTLRYPHNWSGPLDWTPIFLARLSEARNLESIDIENIQFPASDVVLNAFRLVPDLPMLQSFRFLPWIPPSAAASWVIPSADDLRDIVYSNPMLTSLAVPFNCSSLLNPLPSDFLSTHQMQFLALVTSPNFRLASLPFSTKLQLSLNPHTLFPFLQSVTDDLQPDSAEWSDWQPIEMLMATHRQVHAPAIQNAQQQVDIALYIHAS